MDLQGDLLESQSRRSVELGQRGLGSAEAEEDEEHGESMALLDRTQVKLRASLHRTLYLICCNPIHAAWCQTNDNFTR